MKRQLEVDNSSDLQFLIDICGVDSILQNFALFLGRDNCDIEFPPTNGRSTRSLKVPKHFYGLGFDGAHWKGYENGIVKYESYFSKVQSPGTCNYCQSYACFMWASGGLHNKKHNVTLKPSDYHINIMKVSKLWAQFIREIYKNKETKSIILNALKLVDSGHTLKELLDILDDLSTDENYALEFSRSKE